MCATVALCLLYPVLPAIIEVMMVIRLTDGTQPLLSEAAALLDQYRQHYGANPAPDVVEEWMLDQVVSSRALIYVAGEVQGICSVAVVPAALTLRTVWHIRDLYVRPDSRRLGVARALLERVADDARQAGAHRLSLQTETANVRAIELYAKFGFTALTDVTVMDGVLPGVLTGIRPEVLAGTRPAAPDLAVRPVADQAGV
jgi:GNAT superfamily N-acetyltransferase